MGPDATLLTKASTTRYATVLWRRDILLARVEASRRTKGVVLQQWGVHEYGLPDDWRKRDAGPKDADIDRLDWVRWRRECEDIE